MPAPKLKAPWRSAKSAPKDGTPFIGIVMIHGGTLAHTVEWCEFENGWIISWGAERLGVKLAAWMPLPSLESDATKARARSRHHHSAAQRRDNTR